MLCEMPLAAEFEIVDDLTNIIHLHNVTLHELYFSPGEFPIKTKFVTFFSLYKDMGLEIWVLWNLMQFFEQ